MVNDVRGWWARLYDREQEGLGSITPGSMYDFILELPPSRSGFDDAHFNLEEPISGTTTHHLVGASFTTSSIASSATARPHGMWVKMVVIGCSLRSHEYTVDSGIRARLLGPIRYL